MRKRILAYRRRIDALLAQHPENTDWNRILQDHLRQIAFFQHERLVHLIVTMTFAVLTMLSFGIVLLTQLFQLTVLTAALLVLLIPYIFITICWKTKSRKCMRSMMKSGRTAI